MIHTPDVIDILIFFIGSTSWAGPWVWELLQPRPVAEREFLLIELGKLVQINRGGESPVHIADHNGKTVGYIFPPTPHPTEPPILTPEEEEDLRQRFETPDDVLTTEELLAPIRQGPPAATAKS